MNEVVWQSVKKIMDVTDEVGERLRIKAEETRCEKKNKVKALAELQKEKEKCEADRFTNYDGFLAGSIGKEEYLRKREELKSRMDLLERKIREMEEGIREDGVATDDEVREALDVLKKYKGETRLTKEIVDALVDKVVIYDPERVEVRWKLVDEVVELLEDKRQ